jgi:hypothetical protein
MESKSEINIQSVLTKSWMILLAKSYKKTDVLVRKYKICLLDVKFIQTEHCIRLHNSRWETSIIWPGDSTPANTFLLDKASWKRNLYSKKN